MFLTCTNTCARANWYDFFVPGFLVGSGGFYRTTLSSEAESAWGAFEGAHVASTTIEGRAKAGCHLTLRPYPSSLN
jgi:hypothetical protein